MADEIREAVIRGFGDIAATRYAQLASCAIILYDHLITLDDEIELIWKNKWTAGKLLFIINRYYTLFSVAFNNYGLFSQNLTDDLHTIGLTWFRWQGWTGLLNPMIVEIILQMRLYAMYLLNKRILALMVTAFVLSYAASATIMGVVLSKIKTTSTVPLTINEKFCVPNNVSHFFYAFWIPILAYESLLCGLALNRAFRTCLPGKTWLKSSQNIFTVLIRDSVFYFVVIFCTYLTNFLVFLLAREHQLEIPIGFSVAMSCVLGNRIIFNIRRLNNSSSRTSKSGFTAALEAAADPESPSVATFLSRKEREESEDVGIELAGIGRGHDRDSCVLSDEDMHNIRSEQIQS